MTDDTFHVFPPEPERYELWAAGTDLPEPSRRAFLEIVRAVFLKGVGPADLWSQYAALLVMGGGLLAFATARFRKRTG